MVVDSTGLQYTMICVNALKVQSSEMPKQVDLRLYKNLEMGIADLVQ